MDWGGLWYAPGSVVEYAWTRRYPNWCRRMVPLGLEDATEWYRGIVGLLPEIWRWRREGLTYRGIARRLVDLGYYAFRTSVPLLLEVHGYVEMGDVRREKFVRMLDHLVLTGSFRESGKAAGWSSGTVEVYLNYLGLRPRRMDDVVRMVKEDEEICAFKDVIRVLKVSSLRAQRLMKENGELRELFAERRRRRLLERRRYLDSFGVPEYVIRSSVLTGLLLVLSTGPKTMVELQDGLDGGKSATSGPLHWKYFQMLMKDGYVDRFKMVSSTGRRSYHYMLTAGGSAMVQRLLLLIGKDIGFES